MSSIEGTTMFIIVHFRNYGPNPGCSYAGRYGYGLLSLSTFVTSILRNGHPRRGSYHTSDNKVKHGDA